jgi:calreticulin
MNFKYFFVGIDVWQVKAGTIYDDILITDSEEEAATQRTELLERIKKEKEAFDRAEDIKREQQEKERKEAEEKAKNTPPPTPQEAEAHADQDLEKLAREKAEQLKKEAGDATGRDEL